MLPKFNKKYVVRTDEELIAKNIRDREFKQKLLEGKAAHVFLGGHRRVSRVKVTLPRVGKSDDT